MNYTPEQTRRIEAAVAKAMGYPVYSPGELYGRTYPHFTEGRDELLLWFASSGRGLYFHPTTDHEVWIAVERFMVETFTSLQKVNYPGIIRELLGHDNGRFEMLTAPLLLRCLAFLRAMGVDVDALLADGEPAGEQVTE